MANCCCICMEPFNVSNRLPRVLKCGHTFCTQDLASLAAPIRCPSCRQVDNRPVAELPCNFALAESARLDATAAVMGAQDSASRAQLLSQLWLNESELQLLPTVLGTGATGQVVEGTYVGRQVAVKVIDLSEATTSTRQALMREAAVVLRVSGECRHCCQYKGATVKGNQFCLVMKRYPKSLAQVIAEGSSGDAGLPLARVTRYAAQVLGCLHELHSLGVVMADLKPKNLLLDEALDELVVTDFGLSRIVSNTVGTCMSTLAAGQGTPHYMPPEQHAVDVDEGGSPLPLTPAADMWAWACTVIHMATGQPPLAKLTVNQIILRVGAQKRAPEVPTSLHGPLQQLLRACLAVQPSERPTALQALQMLQPAYPHDPAAAYTSNAATPTAAAAAAVVAEAPQAASSAAAARPTGALAAEVSIQSSPTPSAPPLPELEAPEPQPQPATDTQPATADMLVTQLCSDDPAIYIPALHQLRDLLESSSDAAQDISDVRACLNKLAMIMRGEPSSPELTQEVVHDALAVLGSISSTYSAWQCSTVRVYVRTTCGPGRTPPGWPVRTPADP